MILKECKNCGSHDTKRKGIVYFLAQGVTIECRQCKKITYYFIESRSVIYAFIEKIVLFAVLVSPEIFFNLSRKAHLINLGVFFVIVVIYFYRIYPRHFKWKVLDQNSENKQLDK